MTRASFTLVDVKLEELIGSTIQTRIEYQLYPMNTSHENFRPTYQIIRCHVWTLVSKRDVAVEKGGAPISNIKLVQLKREEHL